MNLANNLYNWLSGMAFSIFGIVLIFFGVKAVMEKSIVKTLLSVVGLLVCVVFLFNPAGVRDWLLELGNMLLS